MLQTTLLASLSLGMALQLQGTSAAIVAMSKLLDQRSLCFCNSWQLQKLQGPCLDFKMNEEASTKFPSVKGTIYLSRLTHAN